MVAMGRRTWTRWLVDPAGLIRQRENSVHCAVRRYRCSRGNQGQGEGIGAAAGAGFGGLVMSLDSRNYFDFELKKNSKLWFDRLVTLPARNTMKPLRRGAND